MIYQALNINRFMFFVGGGHPQVLFHGLRVRSVTSDGICDRKGVDGEEVQAVQGEIW